MNYAPEHLLGKSLLRAKPTQLRHRLSSQEHRTFLLHNTCIVRSSNLTVSQNDSPSAAVYRMQLNLINDFIWFTKEPMMAQQGKQMSRTQQ